MKENLKELKAGETANIIVKLKKVESADSVNGEYQKLLVMDKFHNQEIIFNFTTSKIPSDIAPAVVKIGVSVGEYKNNLNYKMENYSVVENGNLTMFDPPAMIDYKKSWKNIMKYLPELSADMRIIVKMILKENQKDFLHKPLTANKSFSRTSGLLEATEKLMLLSKSTAEICGYDKNLMLAGSVLYFIGHIDSVDAGYNETVEDELIGTSVLAQNKILLAYQKLKESLNTEEESIEIMGENVNIAEVKKSLTYNIDNLFHIVLSRSKGIYSATPEALALRHLSALVMDCEEIKE